MKTNNDSGLIIFWLALIATALYGLYRGALYVYEKVLLYADEILWFGKVTLVTASVTLFLVFVLYPFLTYSWNSHKEKRAKAEREKTDGGKLEQVIEQIDTTTRFGLVLGQHLATTRNLLTDALQKQQKQLSNLAVGSPVGPEIAKQIDATTNILTILDQNDYLLTGHINLLKLSRTRIAAQLKIFDTTGKASGKVVDSLHQLRINMDNIMSDFSEWHNSDAQSLWVSYRQDDDPEDTDLPPPPPPAPPVAPPVAIRELLNRAAL